MKVAVLGTGIMGAPMARNLAAAGHEVRAWNRTIEKAEPLAGDGVEVIADAAQAVEGVEVVVTMLIDGDAVLEVMGDAGPALGGDTVWAQMSTVGLAMLERCAKLADEHGVAFVDAPVLGTKQPAEQGELVVLAAGDAPAIDRCEPVFEAVGQKLTRLGGIGEATRAKLVLNSWVLAVVQALSETAALADALGVDKQLFLDTIEGGGLDIGYAHLKVGGMIKGEYDPAFPLSGAAKDVGLILQAAESAGVDLPALETALAQFERGIDAGHGDKDMSAAYLVVSRDAAG